MCTRLLHSAIKYCPTFMFLTLCNRSPCPQPALQSSYGGQTSDYASEAASVLYETSVSTLCICAQHRHVRPHDKQHLVVLNTVGAAGHHSPSW